MEPLERNRLSKCSGQTGNHVTKSRRLRDETRNRRQHVDWISLEHLCDRTNQYNPTCMPASAPVRVAILVAALVAVVAGYRWWNSPERQVNRLLSDIATALSHESAETDLRALTAVAALQPHLTPDVSIDMGGGASPIRRRQDVIATATRVRASSPMMRVQFFDPEVTISAGASGTTRVTVQVTTRDAGGQEVAAAYTVSMNLVLAEGRWQIASARVLPERGSTT